MPWFAQAPANIALIKYMGKKNSKTNLPDNASLSYTLHHLNSRVMLEETAQKKDVWEPLREPGKPSFTLSKQAQQRFLMHLSFLKNYFGYRGFFIVRSTNNFPQDSGLASSASSFAALTRCVMQALSELEGQTLPSVDVQAQLSRQGSGSSCRSFYSPWALWREDKVVVPPLPFNALLHRVILISTAKKNVTSSEAHQRVKGSRQYLSRLERAEENLAALLSALESRDWSAAFQLCWREFQDMHQLFAQSQPPFSYMREETHAVLRKLLELWQKHGDGPLVTMDAGPNIHLLYRPEHTEMAFQFEQDYLKGTYDVL